MSGGIGYSGAVGEGVRFRTLRKGCDRRGQILLLMLTERVVRE